MQPFVSDLLLKPSLSSAPGVARFAAVTLWLLCAALAQADDAAPLPVLEEKPASFTSLGTVTASSKNFSGRTDNGKRSYVMRELQRQARKLGANAIWLKKMQQLERRVPVYGRFNTITQYEKRHEFLGSGEAITLENLPAEENTP